MKALLRGLATLIAVVSVYLFVYWVPVSIFAGHDWLRDLLAMFVGMVGGWIVWRFTGSRRCNFVMSFLGGALIVGGIGFVGGFFGPLLLAPEANQGPLIGMFVTGPAGFVVGGIIGVLRWQSTRRVRHDV
ncbi:MAG: hypothetical protein ACR2QU_06445 [Gammaproteobacteria bacterium]